MAKNRQAIGNSTHRKNAIVSLISALFLRCSELDVARFVIPRIVNSVHRLTWRALSNVFQESRERFSPTFTDSNSSTAIIFVLWTVGVGASSDHIAPHNIHRVFAQPMLQIRLMWRTIYARFAVASQEAGMGNWKCSIAAVA